MMRVSCTVRRNEGLNYRTLLLLPNSVYTVHHILLFENIMKKNFKKSEHVTSRWHPPPPLSCHTLSQICKPPPSPCVTSFMNSDE